MKAHFVKSYFVKNNICKIDEKNVFVRKDYITIWKVSYLSPLFEIKFIDLFGVVNENFVLRF